MAKMLSALSELLRSTENVVEHGLGESTCERILLAYVVAAKQRKAVSELDLDPVSKFWSRANIEVSSNSARSDTAERDDHACIDKRVEFASQKRPAGVLFVGGGFVVWWRALDCARHPHICELEPVVDTGCFGLVCKSCPKQARVEPVS